jgi:ubiquinone/menaquinone biosynthesis C-methylase UbiE
MAAGFGPPLLFVAGLNNRVDKQMSWIDGEIGKSQRGPNIDDDTCPAAQSAPVVRVRMNEKLENLSIWDRYWRADRIASCFDVIGCNYDEALLGDWRAFFLSLDDGARILDLCTGNGAIALVAAKVTAEHAKSFHVEAIDRAAIDPIRFVSRETEFLGNIAFHGHTSSEALPFADAAFDAVTSQYGIEYTSLPETLAEATRVLAPGGRIRFGLHAAEGHVVQRSNRDISDCRYLALKSGLFKAAEKAIRAARGMGRGPVAPARAERVRARKAVNAFKASLEATGARAKGAVNPAMYNNVTSLLADTFDKRDEFPLETLLDLVGNARLEVLAHLGRLEALVAAARSEDDISDMIDSLAGLGFENAGCAAVTHGDEADLVGWVVTANAGY